MLIALVAATNTKPKSQPCQKRSVPAGANSSMASTSTPSAERIQPCLSSVPAPAGICVFSHAIKRIVGQVNSSDLSSSALDLRGRFPLQAASRLTRALPESVRLTGDTRDEPGTMSTRHEIRAIEQTASNAGAAASLILGTLLLLIRP